MTKKKDLPYNKNPYEVSESPSVKAGKPPMTNKTKPSTTGVRGAQATQKSDGERYNRGAVKPWKPKGRK